MRRAGEIEIKPLEPVRLCLTARRDSAGDGGTPGETGGGGGGMLGVFTAVPKSTKVYVPGAQDVRVPMREIALSGGERPIRVYDTSGPQGHDVKNGLPKLREP